MDRKQLMEKTRRSLTASGIGKTKDEAFGKALEAMRKQVYKDVEGMILKMEPLEVYLDEVHEEKEIEKFLFLFMPREKWTYKMTFTFVVEISYIARMN
ncbi:DUF4312 family protein [Fusibacter ferrireducens]|uniref:DUF4312 family protein n=1 Tax=Fusibacter ferrireducens TaxID=2785058 RepID=A0ABR9ZWK0_9FIRM|nr:DUF4312 family protein [Fusibacter ferrireducens]MBF4694731.1 DUF4312 family protein [Fusibacter ferrireducens]